MYDDRISQKPGRGTLVVTIPETEDIGQYQCYAYNEFGVAISNSVFVRKSELNAFKDTEYSPFRNDYKLGNHAYLNVQLRRAQQTPCNDAVRHAMTDSENKSLSRECGEHLAALAFSTRHPLTQDLLTHSNRVD